MAKSLTIQQGAALFLGGVTYRAGDEDKLQQVLDAQFEGKPAEQRKQAEDRLAKLGQVTFHPSGRVSGAEIDQEENIPAKRPAGGAGRKQAELTDADPTLNARREMGANYNGPEEHQNASADPGDIEEGTERIVIQPGAQNLALTTQPRDDHGNVIPSEGAGEPKAKPAPRKRNRGKRQAASD